MANKVAFGEGIQIFPVLSPISSAAGTLQSYYVDLDMANWVTFLINFGALTSDDTDTVTVLVQCSTADSSNASEEQIGFWYRLSSAQDAYLQGTITRATSDGIVGSSDSYHATDLDNKLLIIDIDPSDVAAKADDMRFVRVVLTTTFVAGLNSVTALVASKYPGNTIPSST